MKEDRHRYDALVLELSKLNDAQIIAKLESLPALKDEDDPVWNNEEYWHDAAEVFLALSDISRKRRLRASIRLLLERACYGDPGEIMRGLRHSLEAIASPDWLYLADICIDLAESPRKGTQLWATEQLAILEDPRANYLFERLIESEEWRISDAAAGGLERLARNSAN